MSHVIAGEFGGDGPVIDNMEALARAAARCGLEFRHGQRHYNTLATDHGKLVGDYPVPAGWTAEEICAGRCTHAVVIPANLHRKGHLDHYEIGVIPSKTTPGAFSLIYDFFGGSLDEFVTIPGVGGRMDKLYMYYQIESARDLAKACNMVFTEKVEADGSLTCEAISRRSF